MFARIERSISNARDAAQMIGWRWVITERALRKLGIKETSVRVAGLVHPVHLRVGTSDVFEFSHLLGVTRSGMDLPLKPQIIVDAGANVGYSVLRWLKEFPEARIVALEPEPRNVIQLKKNCAPYQNVAIEEKALWSKDARLRIRSLDVAACAFEVEEDSDGDVYALSVTSVIKRHALPRIDLLKIDIEGSEKAVFSNAQDWLPSVGMILIELHDRFQSGCTEIVEQAVRRGFSFGGQIDEYSLYVANRLQ